MKRKALKIQYVVSNKTHTEYYADASSRDIEIKTIRRAFNLDSKCVKKCGRVTIYFENESDLSLFDRYGYACHLTAKEVNP